MAEKTCRRKISLVSLNVIELTKFTRIYECRLAESVQGNELEKIFGKGDVSVTESVKGEEDDPLVTEVNVETYVTTPVQNEHFEAPSAIVKQPSSSSRARQRNKCDI